MKRIDSSIADAAKDHVALFRGQAIATEVLAPVLARAFNALEELHDQGKIPNTTIPVLQDRLDAEVCICGETLKPRNADGAKRRAEIERLISDNQRADEFQKIVTALFYGARQMQGSDDTESKSWLDGFSKVEDLRNSLEKRRVEAGRRLRALQEQLDSLPDTDIQGLRDMRRQYSDQRDRQLSRQSTLETRLATMQEQINTLNADRKRLLHEQEKGARILAELEVTQDIMQVLTSAYSQITDQEVQKVSELMDSIFIEMIGADPDQGAIIQRAEISPEFDIIVYGPNNRTLDPDRDLNGASRRALTLAFILALTKVSEVVAPNVIDTPLGMTSGFVKHSILRTAVRESTQLILFLTHDEIINCEEIIDEFAGVVVTLTNPAHYPVMLVNDPGVTELKVLLCTCDHRNECQICQRHLDAPAQPETVH